MDIGKASVLGRPGVHGVALGHPVGPAREGHRWSGGCVSR
jgi:hypothetical protein